MSGSGEIRVKDSETALETPTFDGLTDQSGHKLDGRPYATALSITSTPELEEDTYGLGEVIRFKMTFDQKVDAHQITALTVNVGTTVGTIPDTRPAFLRSGRGTASLVFAYTVAAGDTDSDGVSADFGSDHIVNAAGTTTVFYQYSNANPNYSLGDQSGHKVDGFEDG